MPGKDEKTQDSVPKLSFPRAYSLALAPQLIYSRSSLLPTLVSSKVYRQLDLHAVGSWWIYTPGEKSTEQKSEINVGHNGRLLRVPSGRQDIFVDQTIDISSKRKLMKFLHFVAEYENQSDTWRPYASTPFSTFLTEQFKLKPELHTPFIALTLSHTPPQRTNTEFALGRIANHLRSMGLFGPGFCAMIPKWGGLSEVTQVACRAGAVGGGVYALGTGIDSLGPIASSNATTNDGPDSGGAIKVQLSDGSTVTAKHVVGCEEELPANLSSQLESKSEDGNGYATRPDVLARSVSIISPSLSSLFPSPADGAPLSAASVVYFPSGSLSDRPEDADNGISPVYIMVHNSDTGECPKDQGKSLSIPSSCAPTSYDESLYEYLPTLSVTTLMMLYTLTN